MAPLGLSDFLDEQGDNPCPVLFVIVNDRNHADHRIGYNPASPPTDEEIRVRWWQLARRLPAWASDPGSRPGLQIAIFGSPGRQMVVASARIDRQRWPDVEPWREGKIQVPLLEPVHLDAFGMRGRRVDRETGIRFGGILAQFYMLLSLKGSLSGGSHSPGRDPDSWTV